MICFEFEKAEANWLTLLLLLRGESARDFNVIVLQQVNSNCGLKQSPGFFSIILLKYFTKMP